MICLAFYQPDKGLLKSKPIPTRTTEGSNSPVQVKEKAVRDQSAPLAQRRTTF